MSHNVYLCCDRGYVNIFKDQRKKYYEETCWYELTEGKLMEHGLGFDGKVQNQR